MMLKTFTILCVLTYLDHAHTLKCDPLDNVYYHKQLGECLPCGKCLVGMEKITLEESDIEIDSINGPSTCIPCRPCKTGYYSDVYAYKCKTCTNCTLLNMLPLKTCRREANAICQQKPIGDIGSSKDEDIDTDEESSTSNSSSTTDVVVIVVPVVIVVCLLGLGLLIWKRKRANGATSNTGRDEVVEYDYSSSSPILSQPQQQADTCKEICEDGNTDSSGEEDEHTPLIPQKRPQQRTKRRRYTSDSMCEYKMYSLLEEAFTPVMADNSCCNRHSCSYDNLKEISLYSNNNNQNTVPDSGFINFTLRTEPHKILKSFNIQDEAPIIKKVKEWDLKYRQSNTPKVSKPMSAYMFLTRHASNKPDILKKVQCWEMRDELLTVPYMSKVARNLGPGYKFRSFAREAGLSETDLTNIQQNYKDDVVEQGYQVLQKLKQKEVIKTELDVINIIEHLDLKNILNKISR